MESLLTYGDYREYLRQVVGTSQRSGSRSRLAKAVSCHLSYLTRVLNDQAHLSPEQGIRFCNNAGFNPTEREYFMTLLNFQRAGSPDLKRFYRRCLDNLREKSKRLANRMPKTCGLSEENQAIYYSHWRYATVHVLTSMNGGQQSHEIAKRLDLEIQEVERVLAFLVRCQLVERKNNCFRITSRGVHLEDDSHLIPQYHNSWRSRTMTSIDHPRDDDVHYSGVLTVSETDLQTLQDKVAIFLEDVGKLVIESKEERCVGLCIDLFDLSVGCRNVVHQRMET